MDDPVQITGEVPGPRAPSDPVEVPLVIYIGNLRRIIGRAVVTGGEVSAYIDPSLGTADLEHMITDGIIQGVSVSFNAPPATPVYKDGTIRWEKNY
jgi:hypothetical protein